MSGSRTEEPTSRKLRQARGRGEVPVSRELVGAASLLSGLVALSFTGRAMLAALVEGARAGLLFALSSGDDVTAPWRAVVSAAGLLARTSLPSCLAAAAGGAAAGLAQSGGYFGTGALRFSVDRLRPDRGLARLFSADRLVATGLGALKSVVILLAAWGLLRGLSPAFAKAALLEERSVLPHVVACSWRLLLPLAGLAAAFGVLDLALCRRRHRRALRMTKDEVRRERREDEGDPRIRAERRRLHRALLSAMPLRRATCLVVNPTHFAVALHHAASSDAAPLVVAKGEGAAAALLRREARRAGVPVVRDIPLARALFHLASVGDEIPEELYDAAALLLVHLHARPEGCLERLP